MFKKIGEPADDGFQLLAMHLCLSSRSQNTRMVVYPKIIHVMMSLWPGKF